MTIQTPQRIESLGVSESSVCREIALARQHHGAGMRNDHVGAAIDGARAQMRAHLHSIATVAHRVHDVEMPSQERLDSIASQLASALGYRCDDGEWRHESIRQDASSFFRDELTDRNGLLHRPRQRARALSEVLPSRSVSAYAERYESRFMSIEGSVTHYKPGTTKVATVHSGVAATKRDIHTFVTSTQSDWLAAMQGSQSSVDKIANDAVAVREVFADFLEGLLVNGIGSQMALWGLADLPVLRLPMGQDYSGAVTMSQAFADFAAQIDAVLEAHDERGDSPDTIVMSPRLARKLTPLNNISDGGDMTGSDLRAKLANLFDGSGITRWISAPSLRNFGGASGTDAAILCRLDGERGLHQVPAMTPTAVRSVQSLTGQQTLWAMRHGGVDINDATACAILTATVA